MAKKKLSLKDLKHWRFEIRISDGTRFIRTGCSAFLETSEELIHKNLRERDYRLIMGKVYTVVFLDNQPPQQSIDFTIPVPVIQFPEQSNPEYLLYAANQK